MTEPDRYRHPDCETCNQQGPEFPWRQDLLRLHRAMHDLLWTLTLPKLKERR